MYQKPYSIYLRGTKWPPTQGLLRVGRDSGMHGSAQPAKKPSWTPQKACISAFWIGALEKSDGLRVVWGGSLNPKPCPVLRNSSCYWGALTEAGSPFLAERSKTKGGINHRL